MDQYDAAPKALNEFLATSGGIQRQLISMVRQNYVSPQAFVAEAEAYLRAQIPKLAQSVRAGQLLAFFRAARATLKDTIVPPRAHQSQALPAKIRIVGPGGATVQVEPSVTFPQTERAANWLRERIGYSPAEFAALDHQAQRVGFTVARLATANTVDKFRNMLADTVGQNVGVRDFQGLVRDTLDVSNLSDPQLETLFRTHTGRAYAAGQMHVLQNDLVADEFPYLLYSATHDSRVRDDHLEMESLGLDGTAVYRVDDPIWDTFYPPWAWNCRCVVIPLSVEDAASYGVREALEWLRTGVAPEKPEWVKRPPFDPPPGWIPTAPKLRTLHAAHSGVALSAMHAPKGGVTVAGQKFTGGQFIPAAVVAQATSGERRKLRLARRAAAKPARAAEAGHVTKGHVKRAAEAAAMKVLHYGYEGDRIFRTYVLPAVEAVIDTPDDIKNKFGYNPSISSGGATDAHNIDPVKGHLGISAHFAATILSHAIPFVFARMRKILKARAAAPANLSGLGGADRRRAVAMFRDIFAAVVEELGLPVALVPSLKACGDYIDSKLPTGTTP